MVDLQGASVWLDCLRHTALLESPTTPPLGARGTGQQLSSPATENQVLLLSSLLGPVKQETK